LLHPQIDQVIAHASRHSQVSVTTNGFLLSDELIDRLNGSGLSWMQVSVDQVKADKTLYIQKTLKTLATKLERVKKRAQFSILLGVVLGEHPEIGSPELVGAAKELTLPLGISIENDSHGQISVRGQRSLDICDYYMRHLP